MKYNINKLNIEQTDCPICNTLNDKLLYFFDPFKLVKCTKCGLVYLSSRLNENFIFDHYSEEDFYNNYTAGTGYEMQEYALRGTFMKFLKVLHKKGITNGRLLEVGCGFGYLLDLAKNYFSYCAGTDFSKSAVEKAQNFCDNVYCGGLESIPDTEEKFDCIIAFSVIEHVYKPNEFIEGISTKLKSGGLFIIATPDVGSYWSKLLKKKWPFYINTEHVCLYDKHTLNYLLKSNHYKNINSFSFAHAWPIAAFCSKIGLKRLGLYLSKYTLGKIPVFVPNTIICSYGFKV